ncbi:hypothetical protein IAI10_16065 [Clostridium sp. 19966]|uniref:hypothetical protein n=1 Tax=Clostridium sp. 19966 TaxID=2768166 RepID=UPI0028E02216|nr:hypothetical protein [Clostridium sp. 19966]MDT8718182.1 hypothetical protein [Clostridium sp. 19966]
MRKYIIEVSEEGIKKTFIDGNKKHEETWVRTEDGSKTTGVCITEQLEQDRDFEEEDLIELLDEDDIDGIWDYLEENPGPSKGKLIKNLATCDKCKSDLISKYENGIWGFSILFGDKETGYYTDCPFCKDGKKYNIQEEDIKDIIKD